MHRLLVSPFHDPYLNLALEGHFLETLPPGEELLFLYTNDPAVVIGRFQNPWKESRPSDLKQTDLVRRESGGGTVYHDRGNLNFSFIQHNDGYDRTENLERICKIMAPWELPLFINERHDLMVNHNGAEYKVSGSAFRHKKDRAFHHGTLLINCRTEKLKTSITPGEKRIFLKSSGTASKRSPVINLQTLREPLSMENVLETFRSHYRNSNTRVPVGCRVEDMDLEQWRDLATSLKTKTDELRSDAWIYGKTPAFTQDLSALAPPVSKDWTMRVEKGIITEVPVPLEGLADLPYGRGLDVEILRDRLGTSPVSGFAGDEFLRRLLSLIA